MSMKSNEISCLSTQNDWDEKWTHIFDHYQQDLRHAYYINAVRRKNETKILEIGAGSFRDIMLLRSKGLDCTGVDFSAEAVSLAKSKFSVFAESVQQMDAFKLDFADSEFDLTYHNGLWVCFDNDDILKLAKEQARVSKKRMIATVHNAHNRQFMDYFSRMKMKDPLYNIRFFYLDEVEAVMRTVCKKVYSIPVGKAKKGYEDWLIKHGINSPTALKACFAMSGKLLLEKSERLLCIGEL